MNDMPTDLSQFLDTMFTNQQVVMTQRAKEPEELPFTSFTKDADGVWTLIFFDKTLGWVNRVTGDVKYRAMSAVSYNMEQFYSLDNAKNYLFEQSH